MIAEKLFTTILFRAGQKSYWSTWKVTKKIITSVASSLEDIKQYQR